MLMRYNKFVLKVFVELIKRGFVGFAFANAATHDLVEKSRNEMQGSEEKEKGGEVIVVVK